MSDVFIDVKGRITILPHNKMSGMVKVIAVDKDEISSSMTIKKPIDLTSSIRIYSDNIIVDPKYPPTFGSQKKASISILHRNEIRSSVKINAKNKMSGVVEISPPPRKTIKLYPVQDAFVREGIPTLNYGTEQSMAVGHNSILNESYRSMIQFDLSNLPKDIIIDNASVNLFSFETKKTSQQLGIFSLQSEWTELGVTWNNQPIISSLNDIQNVNDGKIVFDVTSETKNWFDGTSNNFGLEVKAINETISEQVQFNTRENAVDKPFLEITYRDKTVYSFGRSDIPSKMFIYAVGNKDVKASMKIRGFDTNAVLPSRIHIYNPIFMESNLVISKPDLVSMITVRQSDFNEVAAQLTISQKSFANVSSKITISAPDRIGRITIPYRNQIDATITVRGYNKSDLPSKISISRDTVFGSIRLRQKGNTDVTASLMINKGETRDLKSLMNISKPEIRGNIQVVFSSYLTSSMTIRGNEVSEIPSNIVIPHRNDLLSSIEIVGASMIPASININSGFLRGNIRIPAYITNDIRGKMTVRVKWISDIRSTIYIGGDNVLGGYVYIL
ncbi:DNRLRE domain-containing protein [Paenibacillus elgii]|uniref:DNRLRE domain-containing protein n=1 Tax=Paenibacillus elgii TaxID=189691 RepID=UPI0002D26939|nr:DNRLRE domain-containing protein [Paenibacillus elgii]